MIFKKKMAIIGVTALLLCVAVYLNWSYQKNNSQNTPDISVSDENGIVDSNRVLGEAEYVNTQEDDAEPTALSDYFAEVRLNRQVSRDEALAILRESSSNSETSESARDTASLEMSKIASGAVKESRVENLVKAKGFKDCVVIISDMSVNVVVPASEEGLTAQDVAKIKDITMTECEVAAEVIKVIEVQ